jgi:signal transduction histidine kinase
VKRRIGWRLTTWYGLSVLTVLGCSTFIALGILRLRLTADAFHSVADSATAVAALVSGVSANSGAGQGQSGGERVQMGLGSAELVLVAPESGQFVQVESNSGAVVNRSLNLQGRTLPLATTPSVPAQGVRPSLEGKGPPLAWVSLPLQRRGSVVGAVQVAQSLGPVDDFLRAARRVLLWVDVGGAGVAAAIGLLLANKALAPVRGIIAAARRIDAHNLDARLPESGPPDEIRDVAAVLNQALDRIAQAVRAQQRFIAVASHELRTPLAIIQGYAELLAHWQEQDAEVTQQASDAIREEAARMRRMTMRLLILARGERPERGRWERMDLSALARGVYETMLVVAENRDLRLDAPSPVEVFGDPEHLQQIVVILLDNALKYTPKGGAITVRVSQDRHASPSLSVRDDGPGIPPEFVPHLFEPFFRGDEAHSRAQDGFGLGLSIAQLLARAHGGAIRVETALGQGSCFTLILPAIT